MILRGTRFRVKGALNVSEALPRLRKELNEPNVATKSSTQYGDRSDRADTGKNQSFMWLWDERPTDLESLNSTQSLQTSVQFLGFSEGIDLRNLLKRTKPCSGLSFGTNILGAALSFSNDAGTTIVIPRSIVAEAISETPFSLKTAT